MAQIVARQEPLMTKTNVLSKPRGGIKSWLSLQIRRTFSSRLLTGTLDTAQVAGVTWSTTYNLKSPRKQTMMLIWIPGYTTICQFMKELVHHFRDVLFVKLQCKEPSGSWKHVQSHIYAMQVQVLWKIVTFNHHPLPHWTLFTPLSSVVYFMATTHIHYHMCSHMYSSGHVTI